VVAREFGVPAVVAVRDVLSTLTDGEPLEVDAAAGTVRRLFPVTWDDPEDAAIFWRRDDAHNTRVMKPLGIDYIRNGSSYGMRKRDEELGPPVLQRAVPINGRPYVGIKNLRPAAEMAEHQREAARKRRALARRMRRDWDDRYLPELKQTMTWMRELALDELDRDGAVAAWDELWRRHRRTWKIHMLVTAAAYAIMDELAEAHRDAGGGDPADALAITQGLASTLQRLETDLHELTEIARGTPRLADAIARGASLADLRSLDPSFAESADAFLATHGDALEAGEGFGSLDWEQDPAALVRAIAGRLRAPVERPDARLARLRERAGRTVADARARLADRPEELARYDEVLAAALATGPLTEEHNYWLDRRNATNMGRAARTFGARLVRDGTLRAADDVFLLYAAEVRDALRDPKDLATLVAEREREQERWRSYEPPETIGGIDPSQVQAGAQSVAARHLLYRATQDDPRRWLRGAAASAGIARGPARLIRDLGEFAKFQRGDVLVCQSSNVSWIPLFVNASAVVTDVGGPLSHAAVVAREFGIPAVVGTAVGLATLVDGEPLEVDGGTGLVRRLSA
jgi:pyruvate,water dikinase